MNDAYQQYERLVYHIANQYQFGVDREDLYQAGRLGLEKALQNYNPEKESDPVSYVCLYIKGEILKEVNNSREIRVSRDVYKLQQAVREASDELTQTFGRLATTEEIAYYLNEDVSKITWVQSLREPVYHLDAENNQEDPLTLYDTLAHIEKAYDADILDLKTAYAALEEEEQKLINSRYYEDKTQQETAHILGKSQVQVSRSETKILQKLRQGMENSKVSV